MSIIGNMSDRVLKGQIREQKRKLLAARLEDKQKMQYYLDLLVKEAQRRKLKI